MHYKSSRAGHVTFLIVFLQCNGELDTLFTLATIYMGGERDQARLIIVADLTTFCFQCLENGQVEG